MDDWCCDRLSWLFADGRMRLTELDLSDCPRVTERGLSRLTRIPSLRKLRFANTPAANGSHAELFRLLFQDLRPDVDL